MIDTYLSDHARKQAQRRGIASQTLDLVLYHSDRSRKLPGQARALWISRRGRQRLVQGGFPASQVDRTSGVRMLVSIPDDVILTVEHATRRRHWA